MPYMPGPIDALVWNTFCPGDLEGSSRKYTAFKKAWGALSAEAAEALAVAITPFVEASNPVGALVAIEAWGAVHRAAWDAYAFYIYRSGRPAVKMPPPAPPAPFVYDPLTCQGAADLMLAAWRQYRRYAT